MFFLSKYHSLLLFPILLIYIIFFIISFHLLTLGYSVILFLTSKSPEPVIPSLLAGVCMVGRKYIPLGSGHERVGMSKVFDPRIEARGLIQENTWKKPEECSKPGKSLDQFETLFYNTLSPALWLWKEDI